jgi:hypothetical protein
MLDTIGRLANRFADYTIGTVIVLVHVTMADRRGRPRLSAGPDTRVHDLRRMPTGRA